MCECPILDPPCGDPSHYVPFTITFLPAVTPLSEIPAALGGTKS